MLKDFLPSATIHNGIDLTPPKSLPSSVTPYGSTIFTDFAGVVDYQAQHESITKEIEKVGGEIEKNLRKLRTPSFLKKAPPQIVADTREKMNELKQRKDKLNEILEMLSS